MRVDQEERGSFGWAMNAARMISKGSTHILGISGVRPGPRRRSPDRGGSARRAIQPRQA
jgi:hypothetical protein